MAQLLNADEAVERARREQAEWAAVLSMPQPERSVAVRRGVSRKTRKLLRSLARFWQLWMEKEGVTIGASGPAARSSPVLGTAGGRLIYG